MKSEERLLERRACGTLTQTNVIGVEEYEVKVAKGKIVPNDMTMEDFQKTNRWKEVSKTFTDSFRVEPWQTCFHDGDANAVVPFKEARSRSGEPVLHEHFLRFRCIGYDFDLQLGLKVFEFWEELCKVSNGSREGKFYVGISQPLCCTCISPDELQGRLYELRMRFALFSKDEKDILIREQEKHGHFPGVKEPEKKGKGLTSRDIELYIHGLLQRETLYKKIMISFKKNKSIENLEVTPCDSFREGFLVEPFLAVLEKVEHSLNDGGVDSTVRGTVSMKTRREVRAFYRFLGWKDIKFEQRTNPGGDRVTSMRLIPAEVKS